MIATDSISIYSYESADGLFFASEAKALLKILSHLRQMDRQSLAEFVSLGCVLQNRTLFRDVFLLPVASAWTCYRGGRVEKRRYFDLRVGKSRRSFRHSLTPSNSQLLSPGSLHTICVATSRLESPLPGASTVE